VLRQLLSIQLIEHPQTSSLTAGADRRRAGY
jgi:hypothetical protein